MTATYCMHCQVIEVPETDEYCPACEAEVQNEVCVALAARFEVPPGKRELPLAA